MSAENIVNLKQITGTEITSANSYNLRSTSELLAGVLVDKGFTSEAVSALGGAGIAGGLINRYLIGNLDRDVDPYFDEAGKVLNAVAMRASGRMKRLQADYTGSLHENRSITQADYSAADDRGFPLRKYRRNGAARFFKPGLIDVQAGDPDIGLADTPIAVIGAGAAGVLAARTLVRCGFHDVRVFNQSGEQAGGIWNRSDVADGTKNNPFDITFDTIQIGSAGLLRTPDLNGSGKSITQFIQSVAAPYRYDHDGRQARGSALQITRRHITGITPGDLSHNIHWGDQQSEEFPIVVYAPGNGRPLPLSHPQHMVSRASRTDSGVRWQKQLSAEKLRELEGKRIVLVGLGNSTAEMVHQIQRYEEQTGRAIDYRIITNYPAESVSQPSVAFGGHKPLYRQIDIPDLTKLAGDLTHIHDMLVRADEEGKIVTDVRTWHVHNNTFVAGQADGTTVSIPYDSLYTLIGYGQDPKEMDKMGIAVTDAYYGTGAFDYDGEVQAHPGAAGRERLYAGYFGIGPLVRNKYNPNAVVIPGIQGHLNNLLPSLVLRATEYALRNPEEIARRRAARAQL
ncbi:MAG TPA: hypothetical protein VD735_00460 [Candidatus Saccharimonadales bacterium]|nr:hypothetical protein [Candidatus Saccharimonadales bacterium]